MAGPTFPTLRLEPNFYHVSHKVFGRAGKGIALYLHNGQSLISLYSMKRLTDVSCAHYLLHPTQVRLLQDRKLPILEVGLKLCWINDKLSHHINTLRPRQEDRHFADDILKCIFLIENAWISINTSLKFVPQGPINFISILVKMMDWCRPGDTPLSEPIMASLLMVIWVIRPQWVKVVSVLLERFDPKARMSFI